MTFQRHQRGFKLITKQRLRGDTVTDRGPCNGRVKQNDQYFVSSAFSRFPQRGKHWKTHHGTRLNIYWRRTAIFRRRPAFPAVLKSAILWQGGSGRKALSSKEDSSSGTTFKLHFVCRIWPVIPKVYDLWVIYVFNAAQTWSMTAIANLCHIYRGFIAEIQLVWDECNTNKSMLRVLRTSAMMPSNISVRCIWQIYQNLHCGNYRGSMEGGVRKKLAPDTRQ